MTAACVLDMVHDGQSRTGLECNRDFDTPLAHIEQAMDARALARYLGRPVPAFKAMPISDAWNTASTIPQLAESTA